MPAPIAKAAAGLGAALALTASISDSIEDWALALALSRSASLASSASCFRVSVNSAAVAGDRSVERSLASLVREASTSRSSWLRLGSIMASTAFPRFESYRRMHQPRPEERALARVSKDGHKRHGASGHPSRRRNASRLEPTCVLDVPISGKPEIGAPPQDEVCGFKLHPPDPMGFMDSIDWSKVPFVGVYMRN